MVAQVTIAPAVPIDADVFFSSISEPGVNDPALWNSGTTYTVGQRVTRTGVHGIYEATSLAGNLNKIPESQPTFWLFVRKTDKWRAFDKSAKYPTPITADDHISYMIKVSVGFNAGVVYAYHLIGMISSQVSWLIYDHNQARRNLAIYSEEFENATVWAPSGLAFINDHFARDIHGLQHGCKITENSATSVHSIDASVSLASYVLSQVRTISVYAKRRIGTRNLRLQLPTAAFSGSPYGQFDLGTGVATNGGAGGVATMTGPDAEGFYRCSVTATVTNTITATRGTILMTNGGTASYLGDGTSANTIYGFQNEIGALTALQSIWSAGFWGDMIHSGQKTTLMDSAMSRVNMSFSDFADPSGSYSFSFTIYPVNVGEVPQLCEIAWGATWELGNWDGVTHSIDDYSEVTTDTFGNQTVIIREYIALMEGTISFSSLRAEAIKGFLAETRQQISVWFDYDEYPTELGIFCLGTYESFSIPVDENGVCFMPVSIRGRI